MNDISGDVIRDALSGNPQRGLALLERARSLKAEMGAWRREIHRHPELGFEEHRTAQLVANALGDMGLEVRPGVARTGVVGRLGQGRPAVGIRADMDALRLEEETQGPYVSTVPGKMHACGHDAHVAIVLGVAKLLSEMDHVLSGEIRFLFQPSEERWDEEGNSGGKLMVAEGALDGLDAVLALHVDSEMPTGMAEVRSGYAEAAVDSFEATITGAGCHGAYPHTGVDPIFILAQVINAVHGIRARRIDPTEPAVISIGTVHAGQANNVIPHAVEITGTIRSCDNEIRQQLREELERAIAVACALGGDYELAISEGYPMTYNDPEVAEVVRQTAEDLLGPEALHPAKPIMGAEDFSYMAREVPGAMFTLGARIGDRPRPHHSPSFDIDESSLPIGAALLAETVFRLLTDRSH